MLIVVNPAPEMNWPAAQARIDSLNSDQVGDIVERLCEGSELDGQALAEVIRSEADEQAFKAFAGTLSALQYAAEKYRSQFEAGELQGELSFEYHPVGEGWISDQPARFFALAEAGVLQALGCQVEYR